mgnify:CR=1 FL=1
MQRLLTITSSILLLVFISIGHAQWGWGTGEGNLPPRFPPRSLPDRDFAFCKIMYDQVRYERLGMGWSTDYPFAGINLMLRFEDLTTARISTDRRGEPNHWVVRMTDDALFNCPFTMASDVGTIGFSQEEALRMREYLQKGGFLWVDDFWGSSGWDNFSREIGKVLPEFPIVDLPLDHPLFSIVYTIPEVPQIPSIGSWRRLGGGTSELGYDSQTPHMRAIMDDQGRILVLITHNTDISDGWEREAEDPQFFYLFSPDAYAIGVNVTVWVMTH